MDADLYDNIIVTVDYAAVDPSLREEGKKADIIGVKFSVDSEKHILEDMIMAEPEINFVMVDGEEIIIALDSGGVIIANELQLFDGQQILGAGENGR